jgi:hypothetical protein
MRSDFIDPNTSSRTLWFVVPAPLMAGPGSAPLEVRQLHCCRLPPDSVVKVLKGAGAGVPETPPATGLSGRCAPRESETVSYIGNLRSEFRTRSVNLPVRTAGDASRTNQSR